MPPQDDKPPVPPPGFPPVIFPGQPIPKSLGKDVTPAKERAFQDEDRARDQHEALHYKDERPATEGGGLADALRDAISPKKEEEKPKSKIEQLLEEDDENSALTAEELLVLKQMIRSYSERAKDQFNLPNLPITDADRDLFCECVLGHRPYKETMVLMGKKLKVTFREKFKSETDIIFNQIELHFKNGEIRSDSALTTFIKNYELIIQLVDINKIGLPPVVPPKIPDGWTLAEACKDHLINRFSENVMFMLLSAHAQFAHKVRTLAEEFTKENFSTPVAGF